MQTLDLVRDSLGRVHELIPAILDGLSGDDLLWRPDPEANSLGWLVWHLTRIEDDHLARLGGVEQAWTSDGWYSRFGLPYLKSAHGFRMSPAEVGAFNVTDTRYTPPVTVGIRLVSVMVETAQHVGQAGYLRGLRERSMGINSGWAGTA